MEITQQHQMHAHTNNNKNTGPHLKEAIKTIYANEEGKNRWKQHKRGRVKRGEKGVPNL